MRFTKAEVLETFEREETSYHLAYLCTHWLRNTAPFSPSAPEIARGMWMKAKGEWISYDRIAEKLESQGGLDAVVSNFTLTHLHALIRAPLEILRDYSADYDKEVPPGGLRAAMEETGWYWFASMIRNAVSHNFRYEFGKSDLRRLPISWNGITLTESQHGQPIDYQTLWHKTGYELFLEMRDFASALPECSPA